MLTTPGSTEFRYFAPERKVRETIAWFHLKLNHTGRDSLFLTMSSILYHPQQRDRIDTYVNTCETCQQHKLQGRGYGYLAPREALVAPSWYKVAIDTIGPWEIELHNKATKIFHGLTMINTVANLVEMQRMASTSAQNAASTLEMNWFIQDQSELSMIKEQKLRQTISSRF